jgi:hypothetical protein
MYFAFTPVYDLTKDRRVCLAKDIWFPVQWVQCGQDWIWRLQHWV